MGKLFYILIPIGLWSIGELSYRYQIKLADKRIIKRSGAIRALGSTVMGLSIGAIICAMCFVKKEQWLYPYVMFMPFFVFGLLIYLAHVAWYIKYDNEGFSYKTFYWKKYRYSYEEVKRIERYGTKRILYTNSLKIKMDTKEMPGVMFFIKKVSEHME